LVAAVSGDESGPGNGGGAPLDEPPSVPVVRDADPAAPFPGAGGGFDGALMPRFNCSCRDGGLGTADEDAPAALPFSGPPAERPPSSIGFFCCPIIPVDGAIRHPNIAKPLCQDSLAEPLRLEKVRRRTRSPLAYRQT
jgi:hypothetical protein